MDAFYASVEQRDNPELKGKPIAVGGGSKRGVTTTASYEARKFGVRSAMPGYIARQKCPHIIFVKPRFDAYVKASRQIRNIFSKYTDLIEPLSLDEAFLDVTNNKKRIKYGTEIAKMIQKEILDETELTCSAGVSYCKFIAKIASDIKKPFGITVVKPHQAIAFLEKLPIEKFFGVGKVTAAKMNELGIFTGNDIKQKNKYFLLEHFGKSGSFFYDIVRGIDNRAVEPNRERKSLAVERTLEVSTNEYIELKEQLSKVQIMLFERFEKSKFYGKTLTLKIKDANFQIITRSKSVKTPIDTLEKVKEISTELFDDNFDDFGKVRLVGLTVSNLVKEKDNFGQAELDFK